MGLGRRCRESLFVMGTAKHELINLVFCYSLCLFLSMTTIENLTLCLARHDVYASYASYTGSLL